MRYDTVIEGKFLKRPNRFVAHVEIAGQVEVVHVKNTGRCQELLIPGVKVILEQGKSKTRKTKYSIVGVYKGVQLFNMDSQAPNQAAEEALRNGSIAEIGHVTLLKREVSYGNSRFDFYFEDENTKGFIEVKGVTLEKDGIASFPDAPTLRGSKHIKELIEAKNAGYEAAVLFVVQMEGMTAFRPNAENDPLFADSLKSALTAGVKILVYGCRVRKNELVITNRISNVQIV